MRDTTTTSAIRYKLTRFDPITGDEMSELVSGLVSEKEAQTEWRNGALLRLINCQLQLITVGQQRPAN